MWDLKPVYGYESPSIWFTVLQPMNWENEARRIVRAELVRRGITYKGSRRDLSP